MKNYIVDLLLGLVVLFFALTIVAGLTAWCVNVFLFILKTTNLLW